MVKCEEMLCSGRLFRHLANVSALSVTPADSVNGP
jgi:hypothetical protein